MIKYFIVAAITAIVHADEAQKPGRYNILSIESGDFSALIMA